MKMTSSATLFVLASESSSYASGESKAPVHCLGFSKKKGRGQISSTDLAIHSGVDLD